MTTSNTTTPSDILALRHQLHQHPALAGGEQYAHNLIISTLEPLHPTALHTRVGGFGVVAFWEVAGKPCLAFRADTDALPIAEPNDLPYRSQVEGCAHKCGHDGHTAILLHFAQMVSAQHDEGNLPYSVLLVFQPAEETGEGAPAIVASHVLEQYHPVAFFGLHNLPGFAQGTLVFNPNTFAAASSGVCYHLQGRATHASTPELGLNPARCVAEVINALRCGEKMTLAPIDGDDTPLATFAQCTLVGCRIGQAAYGTSAGDADLMFTLRAFTNRSMRRLLDQTHATVNGIAEKHGLQCEYHLVEPFRATENDAALVSQVEALARIHGYSTHLKGEPFRWSEDFAEYTVLAPSCFFGIGVGEDHTELHHPQYDFNDEVIGLAARFFAIILNNISI